MLRSEAITILKRGLGFRPTQDSTIIAALQSAQRTLETGRTLPKWLTAATSCVVTPGVETISLPARFLRLDDEFGALYLTTEGAVVRLPAKNYAEAFEAYVGDATDAEQSVGGVFPKVIVIADKTSARLFPRPTDTSLTSIIIYYYQAALVLDSEIENAWLKYAPEYLIGLAGMEVAGILRDKDALAAFTMMYKRGQGSFIGDVVEDELAGRQLIMGRNT